MRQHHRTLPILRAVSLALGAALLCAPHRAHAGWYVDASLAAAHLGGPSTYGPFPTRAAAQAYVDANKGYGLAIKDGGFDDAAAANVPSGGRDPAAVLGQQIGTAFANSVIQGFRAAQAQVAERNAEIAAQNAAIMQDIEQKKKQNAEDRARIDAAEKADAAGAYDRLAGRMKGSTGSGLAMKPMALQPTQGPGTDTKAGDELVSAAATAKAREDLTVNFDRGGAGFAGTLKPASIATPTSVAVPTAAAGGPDEPAHVKNDPRMAEATKQLQDLEAQRAKLGAERDQLVSERNAASDPQKMAELTQRLDLKEKDYQGTLAKISEQKDTFEKIHHTIDDSVAEPPAIPQAAGAAQANAGAAGATPAH